jgi:creatinine amidohydrolase
MASVLLAELDREEAGRRAAAGAVLVLPVGATEQHGPHLPTCTDTLNVEHVALLAAEQLAGRDEADGGPVPVLVAPALPYGSSEHHLVFGATLSLDAEVLLAALRSLCRSAVESGFGRLFLLNGHGGNEEIVRLAAREASRDTGAAIGCGSWFELGREAMLAVGADGLMRMPGHAGAFETSAVLAVRPDLVGEREPRTPPPGAGRSAGPGPLRVERPGFWQSIDGFTDDPAAADAALGARCLEAASGAVADVLAALAATPTTSPPTSAPPTPRTGAP